MNLYITTNLPELRSIITFNRISTDISETLRRLETGERILTGKDDPVGLIVRESMRADITGIKAAQKTTSAANEFLSMVEGGLANISRLLIGDMNTDNTGFIGLILDDTLPADMRKQQINDLLNLIDGTARSTNYNGKRMLDGSMSHEGALFQLGKDVQDSMQYRMDMPNMTTSNLGGESGKLYELRNIDLETEEGKAQAYAIVSEAISMVARQRGIIGSVQKNVLDNNSKNLDIQLEQVSEAEGFISNVDMALESARLSRAELLAQSAMGAIQYSRDFSFFIASLLV